MKYLIALLCIASIFSQLPTNFDWSKISNTLKTVNYLTATRNGNIPQYCNSSWAFAVSSAMSDRIKIMRNARWPDIVIAPQVLLSCDTGDQGCTGGDPMIAYQYIQTNNITDETCSVYKGWGLDNGLACSASLLCGCYCSQTSSGSYTCDAVPDPLVYNNKNYTKLAQNVQTIMQEIYKNGPIVCGISATTAFQQYASGILSDNSSTVINHYVSIVGWGVVNSTPYWNVRNSWGSAWGEQGYFRIVRGSNNLGIESACSAMYPIDTWTAYEQSIQQTESQEYVFNPPEGQYKRKHRNKGYRPELPKTSHVLSPQPFEYLPSNAIPTSWDWRNVNNTNFLSWNKNQLCCGSCWSEGTTSAFADRINILQQSQFPQATIATQAVLNCAPTFGEGCNGGQVTEAYRWINDEGVGDETCQQYIAESGFKLWCDDKKKCDMCSGPAPQMSQGYGAGNCYGVTNYKKYKISEYGQVSGVDNMKAEIYARGPIACSISTPPAFDSYTGFGIMNIPDEGYSVDHIISVVGYGVENGTSYWIARNSWGTYWGYYGFFRINMNENNLFINDDCAWAVPSSSD